MKVGAMFPSRYLKALDVEGDKTLVIAGVEMQNFKARDGSEEMKPIVSFQGLEKGLVLNKTNSKLISKALQSDDTDDWLGKPITLYSAEVEFGGDIVDSIRVRSKAPMAGEMADEDNIPF